VFSFFQISTCFDLLNTTVVDVLSNSFVGGGLLPFSNPVPSLTVLSNWSSIPPSFRGVVPLFNVAASGVSYAFFFFRSVIGSFIKISSI